jgi:hypothetical protein
LCDAFLFFPALHVDFIATHVKHVALEQVGHIFVNIAQHGIDLVIDRIENSTWWLGTIFLPWLLIETKN